MNIQSKCGFPNPQFFMWPWSEKTAIFLAVIFSKTHLHPRSAQWLMSDYCVMEHHFPLLLSFFYVVKEYEFNKTLLPVQ
jgi:hypothetical protein